MASPQFLLSALLILTKIINTAFGLPESGRWNEIVEKDSTLTFHRSMLRGSQISLKIYCQSQSTISLSWILLQSRCFETFMEVDSVELTKVINASSLKFSDVTYIRGSKSIKCSQSVPELIEGFSPILSGDGDIDMEDRRAIAPGLLAKVWDNGAHVLILKLICSSDKPCSFDATVELEMHNPNGGFLSALDSPFLPFNGVMSLLYLFATILWLVFIIRYWHDLMRIQFLIGFILILGLWEHLIFFAVFETVRKTGQVSASAVYFGELITCAKRTLVRVLMLVACLGYGVTKPRLTALWFRRCLIMGLVFFVLLVLEAISRVSLPYLVTTRFRLVTVVLLSFMDAAVLWGIFTYLARTLRETRIRHNPVKHTLYRRFSYVLLVAFIVSLVFMIASFELFKHHPCIKTWQYLWIDDAFWQFMFFILLVIIMVLWRPSGSNREYAYSLLDNPLETTEEEDILLDRIDDARILSDVRSRQGDDDYKKQSHSDLDGQPVVGPTTDSTKAPISASIIERMGLEATFDHPDVQPVWKLD